MFLNMELENAPDRSKRQWPLLPTKFTKYVKSDIELSQI